MKKMFKHFFSGVLVGSLLFVGLFSWAFMENRVAVLSVGAVETTASTGSDGTRCHWTFVLFSRGSYLVVHEPTDPTYALRPILGETNHVFHDARGWTTNSWLMRFDQERLVTGTCERRVNWAEGFNELS